MSGSERPKTGSFVLPGDWLGVIEEFSPNEGTYDEGGAIFASNAGVVLIDKVERRVKVIPFESHPLLKKGSLALGMVVNTGKVLSTVDIARIGGKTLASPYSGVIHISQISNQFIEKPSDAFKIGDIVKARIIEVRSELIQLSTIGKNLGVVLAFCSKCGSILDPKGNGILICNACGNKEKRKISMDYGKSKI
ncbi:MAG: exosome complex RNA-binding protein Csl4 [Candidatus Freyarchaeota archaeon]|nr:exosome complex RNA-binding protein Csl4 [Candidatus Jordarchaeia archaeon]